MKEITIGGKSFTVRGLRLKERRQHGLDQYGYGRFVYTPPFVEDGAGGRKLDQARAEEGMDKVLEVVLGPKGVEQIDRAGGQKGLDAAWFEIVKETYGARDEEKNSSTSGGGTGAQDSAPATAGPAGQ
jgi:hypothetical protein